MNKHVKRLFIGITCLGSSFLYSQTKTEPASEEEDLSFAFGNISPVILSKGGIEASTTHNLSSYWITSKFGTRTIDRYRISRFESNINVQYGLDNNRRWDLGAQVKYGRIRLDENSRSSPFKVFSGPDVSSSSYQGITSVGLRARVTPFEKNTSFTLQGSVFVPVAKDQDTRSALNADRVQTDLTGTYFKGINKNRDLYLYLQARYVLQISNKDNAHSSHYPGIAALLVKSLLHQKLFVFPGLNYTGAYQQNYAGGRLSKQADYLMASIGAQIQPLTALSIFINAQRPLIYQSGVDVYSDLVKNSYSDWAVGLRVVL